MFYFIQRRLFKNLDYYIFNFYIFQEAIISSEDYGRDYDHCVRLQKKMKEFDQDLAVDAARVDKINKMVEKLIAEGHAGSTTISHRHQNLNEAWNRLQDRASERRQKLAEACEIHAFNRDCGDVADMINEKSVLLSSEDYGKDLLGVEALIRKHDDLERGLIVIEGKMESLETEAHRLVRTQPHSGHIIQAKQMEIIDKWEHLNDLFDERKGKLEANRLLQIFLVDYHDLMTWMTDMVTHLSSKDTAKNVKDSEAMLELNRERKDELERRKESLGSASAFGKSLIEQGHYTAGAIAEHLEELEIMRAELLQLWEKRQSQLEQSHKLHLFLRNADQALTWIANKESFLSSEERSDSLDTVETLLKKQMNLEKSITAYKDKIEALREYTEQLIGDQHCDSQLISSRRDLVLEKWKKLQHRASTKSGNLGESKILFQFLRDAQEVS